MERRMHKSIKFKLKQKYFFSQWDFCLHCGHIQHYQKFKVKIKNNNMNDRDQRLRDYWTLQAMLKFGGGFVKCLAKATEHADPINLSKIKATWPEYWAEYEEKGRKLEEGKKSQ